MEDIAKGQIKNTYRVYLNAYGGKAIDGTRVRYGDLLPKIRDVLKKSGFENAGYDYKNISYCWSKRKNSIVLCYYSMSEFERFFAGIPLDFIELSKTKENEKILRAGAVSEFANLELIKKKL